MDECCQNPDVNYYTYNPGEIRLYGRLPDYLYPSKLPLSRKRFDALVKAMEAGSAEDKVKNVKKEIDSLKKEFLGWPATITINIFSQKNWYIVALNSDKALTNIASAGVIYGYAYEGHCYKLPKPTVMLLPVDPFTIPDPKTKEPKNGLIRGDCGYDPDLGYMVWITDKLDKAVVLDVRIDDLKTLVLDANTPGSRSPLAYAQAQALSPQRG